MLNEIFPQFPVKLAIVNDAIDPADDDPVATTILPETVNPGLWILTAPTVPAYVVQYMLEAEAMPLTVNELI